MPIIGCYTPIYDIASREDINKYPINSDESKAFIDTQYNDVETEKSIKARLNSSNEITDKISLAVQKMYEENPYPQYKHADHTHPHFAKPTAEFISLETTIANPSFNHELLAPNSRPKILIAGCGTGNQVINASRYKNAQITAIDISKNSLSYAARKTQGYKMQNVQLQQLDILDAKSLPNSYDVIECSGVLHHMQDPARGLAALNSKLKPGGYIKIGLYSKLTRQNVTAARELIKSLGIQSTPEEIRDFRRRIFNDDHHELKNLSILMNDFYSLSECRDLCFHVQEHQFTTESLQKLLEAENLEFCGFMVPEAIKMAYHRSFPEDTNGTSLSNWGEFENNNPTTFQSMYQFWSYKPFYPFTADPITSRHPSAIKPRNHPTNSDQPLSTGTMKISRKERKCRKDLNIQSMIKYFLDLASVNIGFSCSEARQNAPMTSKFTRVLLLLAIASPAMAAEPYEPWPSKDQLRSIEHAAYACSRDNATEACARVRQLADPLMDHSRLPGLCKDVLWTLMDQAKVANTNDFRRKDSITTTARRIPKVCAEPVIKKEKPQSRQA